MPVIDLHLQQRTPHATASRAESRGSTVTSLAAERAPAGMRLALELAGQRCEAATRADHAAFLLRDLAEAATAVCEGRSARSLVSFYDTPWELSLGAGDGALLASLYRTGPNPEVSAVDVAVPAHTLAQTLERTLGALRGELDGDFSASLDAALARLRAAPAERLLPPARGAETRARWSSAAAGQPRADLTVAFTCTVPGPLESGTPASPQSDLRALLVPGRLALTLRGMHTALPEGFVFLQVERLVGLCRPLLEAWTSRRPLHLRVHLGAATLGLRLGADERLALSVTAGGDGGITSPALDPRAFVSPVLDAALALAASMVRGDRGLGRNLRLRALRSEARALRRWLRDLDRVDTQVNDDPSRYRCVPADTRAPREPDLTTSARLRYTTRWRAEIEGLDLQGTLLCGDKLLVPGVRELHALDRARGEVVWTVPVSRASTTLAGEDVLRVSPRGEVELRAVSTGETLWTARVAPRVGAPILAHAVTAPGMPRVVVVAEGERRLVGLDLRTGEARWTWAARHSGTFRMRRAGRLLIVTSGDAAVTALDLATGERVWRYGHRAPFTTAPVVHRDAVYALGGEATRGPARIHALGAYTGAPLWDVLSDAPACGLPCATGDTVALPLSTREGVALLGLDAATGEERFRAPLGVVGAGGGRPAVTAFDDCFVANLPTGRVVALDAATGKVRWAHTFRAPVADDVPRRLDVQLRAGALFVPQSSLAVLRPRDGTVLAELDACDLVPDLVRVDEHCAVYVAEESGHLGCFELGARLRVIRPV
jgi:outer membrane protein assembly factor BamB